MYRPGQGFGSFPPSPGSFRLGNAPRGREQGGGPSPGSGRRRRQQHPVPRAAPPARPAGGAGRGRRGPAELPGSVPAAPAYKEGLAVPERRVPRSAPVAPGAAVGEVLGGERVPRDASPRGSPLSALVRLCESPRVPGPAWAAAGPVRSRCSPVRREPGRCRVGSASAPLCAPRCPFPDRRRSAPRGPAGRASPCSYRGGRGPRSPTEGVGPPSGASRTPGPLPAPARRGAAGPLLHVGEGQPGSAPSPHREAPALRPGVAKPPPEAPRRQGAVAQPLGQAVGPASFPDCTGTPYTQALTPATC